MCLTLTKDSTRLKKNLRRRKKPITCYKVLTKDRNPPFFPEVGGKWYQGLNVSTRETTQLSAKEHLKREVYEGFHLYLENPQVIDPYRCPYRYPRLCPYPCPSLYRYQRPYPCRSPCPMIIYRCTVEPEDVAAVGKWGDKTCIAVTKATLHKEIGRLYEPKEE